MTWRDVSEYQPEMGSVVVWLEWPYYIRESGGLDKSGTWLSAYGISVRDVMVWVGTNDSIPIETTGRRVTHFVVPSEPPASNEKGGAK